MLSVVVKFQFHKGTIKTYEHTMSISDYLDFNSIKVRLKLTKKQVDYYADQNFNSIKVRLKPSLTFKR